MRHRKVTAGKLGRSASHRKALMRNMATALFEYESIVTTKAKAKALRRYSEKIITLAKRGDPSAHRLVFAVGDPGTVGGMLEIRVFGSQLCAPI